MDRKNEWIRQQKRFVHSRTIFLTNLCKMNLLKIFIMFDSNFFLYREVL